MVEGSRGWMRTLSLSVVALPMSVAACKFPPLPPLDEDATAADARDANEVVDAPSVDATDAAPIEECLRYEIAFTSTVSPQINDIFVLDAAGGAARNVTRTNALFETSIGWAPDATRIAYAAIGPGPDDYYAVYVVGADGALAPVLVAAETSRDVRSPTWSPDSARVAFLARLGSDLDDGLWIRLVGQSTGLRVADSLITPSGAAWSPDGARLAVMHSVNQGGDLGLDITVVRSDGSTRRNVTDRAGSEFIDADPWSPDGAKLIITSAHQGNTELYIVDVVNVTETRITTTTGNEAGGDWSPDGSLILFTHVEPNGTKDIYTVAPDGSGRRNLTQDTADQYQPRWSPDGSEIVFGRGGDVYVMNVDGSNVRNLTQGAHPGAGSPTASPCLDP